MLTITNVNQDIEIMLKQDIYKSEGATMAPLGPIVATPAIIIIYDFV